MTRTLQWGGRFARAPDAQLLAFGSSLEEDLVLAPFDVRCSLAHVTALSGGGIVNAGVASALRDALARVAGEIGDGSFEAFARGCGAEDVHGAIDARVRELCRNGEGDWLHAGRSRNDQVATTLLLYARDRAEHGAMVSLEIARGLVARAKEELAAGTLLGATTHWQPAQPVLLAFWLVAATEPFLRAAGRFRAAAEATRSSSPLGSAALAGSTLPLDRAAAAKALGFEAPSRNAMDAVGTRDAALDAAHAFVRAVIDASRVAGELVIWCTPAFGYARLGDASSTGSSLMPQKRNPDPFELVRATAAELVGAYAGALGTLCGLPLSYHRDLQQTKRSTIFMMERGLATLRAFARAIADVRFVRERMSANAGDGYTIATDIADALILAGVSARRAHELVGGAVATAESEGRALAAADLIAPAKEAGVAKLDAPLDAMASVRAKRTTGSTNPDEVRRMILQIEKDLVR
ncbi:MAG TPA: argininosuccinate lyase [Candidatus Tyrphobacter sp.]